MNEKVILIVSNKSDITSDLVIKHIRKRNIPFLRLNTEDYPSKYEIHIDIQNGGQGSYIKSHNKFITCNNVFSIWYRRPKSADFSEIDLSRDDIIFSQREASSFLMNFWATMENILWVNNPFSLFKAERKAYQLSIAQKVGFRIPLTVITNSLDKYIDFSKQNSKKIIAKPISHGGYGLNDDSAIYAIDLENRSFVFNSDNIKISPFILQEKINKKFDVRLTVFGEMFFAYKIIPIEKENIDWRVFKPNEIKYEKIAVPTVIKERILNFLSLLNLNFGAFDFAIDKNDDWVFIEVNPNGQFAWLEIATGDSLIDSLIDLLISTNDKF